MRRQQRILEQLEVRTLFTISPVSSFGDAVLAMYSVDGTNNNLANPTWGSTGVQLLRLAAAEYGDGIFTPAGADRPSAREISNTLVDQQGEDIISDRMLSAMVYVWGQFIDHDLDLTPNGAAGEVFNVPVPTGDPSFDPRELGNQVITLKRSAFDPATGTTDARQQINVVTAWLDGSMIYGSNTATAKALRTLVGGKLKTSEGDLLPLNNAATFPTGTLSMDNNGPTPADQLFAAGDVRANENIELSSLHTLFVREHNYWAGRIGARSRGLSDEQIYQQARAMVIAEIQSITFNEWLPAVLGSRAVDRYAGYDPTVNPGIANEFSTAIFRFGHSLLGDDVEFLDNRGEEVHEEVALSEAFFNPNLLKETDVEPILKYLASDPSSELDNKIVDSVRNFLFGPPGAGGLDLASLNIQRGRDHGLADYNATRVAVGLPAVTSFSQISSNADTAAKLEQLYGSVDNVDLWVGALAEDHVRGGSVGVTLRAIISDQFERLRDGDRFWYQNKFSGQTLWQIEHTSLTDIIQRNTDLWNLQDNAFFFRATVAGTVTAAATRFDRFPRGVAGVTVELRDDEGELVATTTTDGRGRYSFDVADGVRTGKYQVSIVQQTQTSLLSRLPVLSRTVSITRGNQFLFDINLSLPLKNPWGGGDPRWG